MDTNYQNTLQNIADTLTSVLDFMIEDRVDDEVISGVRELTYDLDEVIYLLVKEPEDE